MPQLNHLQACCAPPFRNELECAEIYTFQTDVPILEHESHCRCVGGLSHFYAASLQKYYRWHYTKVLSDDQASNILGNYVKSTTDDQLFLVASVRHRGDEILHRWRKRSHRKREALLKLAEPDLPKTKGFIADLEYDNVDLRTLREKRRKCFLLPYLDVQTLVKDPNKLIGLIHHRANYPIEAWVNFDHDQLRCSWSSGYLDVEYNPGCVFMYGPDYGKLTAYDWQATHRLQVVGFPRARLTFEAQATLMSFLRRIVELLLDRVPEEQPASATNWNELIRGGLKTPGEVSSWSSFTHQPFSPPPTFDVDVLLSQAAARVDATGDHLWLLQTEPSYLKRNLSNMSRLASIQSARALPHAASSKLTVQELHADIQLHWFWKDVLGLSHQLREAYAAHQVAFDSAAPISEETDDLLYDLEVLLIRGAHLCKKQLQAMVPERPGFSHMYSHRYIMKGESIRRTYRDLKENFTLTELYKNQRLWWCIMQLQGNHVCDRRFPFGLILDLLDDHLAFAPAAERARLDEVLYGRLSNYIALVEMLYTLRLHRPAMDRDYPENIYDTKNQLSWWGPRAKDKKAFCDCFMVSALVVLQAINPPSGGKNQKWLRQFNAMHGAFQDVWKEILMVYEKYFKKCAYEEDITGYTATLNMWRSPGHLALLDSKRKQILSDITSRPSRAGTHLFLPLPSYGDDTKKAQLQEPKVKIKTRGEAQSPGLNEATSAGSTKTAEDITPIEDSKSKPNIVVPKDSRTIFRSMFPLTVTEREQSVRWDDFVRAMQYTGMKAKNGGGSIVIFEEETGTGKIVFHRPHPNPTIDPIMLQSMGRRMSKWFGWTRDTFVLAGK